VSHSVSGSLRQALQAQQTGEVLLFLLTIEHADWVAPIRYTTDHVPTTSGGETFTPAPFDVQLPVDGEGVPRVRLTLDAVDRGASVAIQALSTPPTVTVQLVLASDPNTIELDWPELDLLTEAETITEIEAELGLDDLSQESFPRQTYNRAHFPGVQ